MFKPAGFAWLFAHESKILWRGSILLRSRRYVLVPVLVVFVVFQAAAVLIASLIARQTLGLPEMILAANLNLFFFGFLMLSRAMSAAIDVLYGRGDVDFLLASPIPPGRVLAVRMIGVAASVTAPWLLLGGVLANGLAAFGQLWALALYIMLPATGLLAASIAFALVVVLVGWVGPGTARRCAHLLSLLMGVLIFALGQAPRYIAPQSMVRLWRSLMPSGSVDGIGWLPGRAMLGQPAPILACIGFCLAVFAIVWITLDGKFASGAISAAAHRPGGAAQRQTGQFRSSAASAAFIKSLRLLARFPGLATQTVYRSLTLVPVLMILSGGLHIGAGPQVVAPLLVFLTGQLGLFFISVIAGSDQSPELAASAPASPAMLRRTALLAASYGVALIMALPIIGVVWREPAILADMLAGMLAVLAANLSLGLRLPIPLIRAEFGKSQTGTVLGLILGVAVSSLFALIVWLAVTPHPFAWLKPG
jgi:ABC-2 type transport system permease protein